ncbi:hypothetical protein B0E53_03766 [Micromonospora sp. MH33]|nr:hypothetical protein B0E53_03766 [Micromonospora sp. MH33]
MLRSRRRTRVLAAVLVGAVLTVAAAHPAVARPALASTTAGAVSTASAWHVEDLGAPVPNLGYARVVGAVSLQDGPASDPRPYMFNVINDALWVMSPVAGSWRWTARGAPPVSRIRGSVGVIKFLGQSTSIERAYVFVYTDDGHLWGNWWDGSRWAWTDIGTPGGTTVSAPVGAVAVQTAPGSQAVPYIYVIGADGHLWWSRKNNTGQWTWTDQGVPAGVTLHRLADPVGAVNLRLSPTQPDLPQVFVLDVQGNLWRHGFDGLTWRWYGHGSPQPSYNAHGVGLVAVQNGPNAASRPEAFIGVNGQVLELTWYNDAWTWSTHSSSGTTYVRHAGTIAVQDGWDTQQRPYVFSCDLEGGPLRTNWWTGAQWVWSVQAGTDAAGLDPSCGDAVALPDRFTGTRYPYVFYWSRQQPMRLMLTWWG